jgi:hypothetical protein
VSKSSSNGLPGPEEFPIGSAESRAAARAMLNTREKSLRRRQIVIDMSHRPPRPSENPLGTVGPWGLGADGNLWRTVMLPRGADEETKRRLLATP